MRLDQDAKERLVRAKKITGSDSNLIDNALRKVLCGVRDHARWIYLFNDLGKRLRSSISRQTAKKKAFS